MPFGGGDHSSDVEVADGVGGIRLIFVAYDDDAVINIYDADSRTLLQSGLSNDEASRLLTFTPVVLPTRNSPRPPTLRLLIEALKLFAQQLGAGNIATEVICFQ